MTGPAPRALLFDFDGVLINSLPVMRLAFGAALHEMYPDSALDADALFDEYTKYLGMGFAEIMTRLELSHDMFEPFRRHSRYLAPYVATYGGAIDLLDWARDRSLVLGIATGKDYDRTVELLARLGIRDYFDSVFSSDTVSHSKPHPDMARRFIAEHGLTCDQVIIVGDAVVDIECGQAAGCRTAAATWGYTPRRILTDLKPTFVFETPADAMAQLDALLR